MDCLKKVAYVLAGVKLMNRLWDIAEITSWCSAFTIITTGNNVCNSNICEDLNIYSGHS